MWQGSANSGCAWRGVSFAKLRLFLVLSPSGLAQRSISAPSRSTRLLQCPKGIIDLCTHVCRHSPGGRAVQAQYRLVLRTMKEARGEGRRGANYADLVCQVLLELPGR